MRILRGPWSEWKSSVEASITIGVFDGVHRGHRALIDRLDSELERTLLTFDPHPIEVLRPGTPPRLITTIDERVRLLAAVGLSQVGLLHLAAIKELGPREFVEEVLFNRLRMRHLVVGPDFRFGRDRTGDVDLLREMGREIGFELDVVELIADEGGPVSSSRIRQLIESGRVAEAADDLTTRFRISGHVVHGDKRGAAIGFPTANLEPPARKVIPAQGVYAAFAHVDGNVSQAAVNVGYRPTFGGGELLIEGFILDFSDEIYGEELTIEFVEYLREELDFSDVSDLIDQIGEDVARTARVLEATTSNVG